MKNTVSFCFHINYKTQVCQSLVPGGSIKHFCGTFTRKKKVITLSLTDTMKIDIAS